MSLTVEYVAVSDIKPYKKNAKKHPAEQVEFIANSIREFGFRQPLVVDRNNVLVIGHGRLLAAKKLGMTEVPVVKADDLTDEQIKALRLADNKTNESEWDVDLLSAEIGDILEIDMTKFGFELAEEQEEAEVVEVELPEEVESRCVLGDVWALGDHRLFCGDATSIAEISKLIEHNQAALVVTDPPYNMGYEGAGNAKNREQKRILNDKMPEDQFYQFMKKVYACYSYFMADGASIYVFYKELGTGVFIRTMGDAGLNFKQELIWVKNQLVLGGSKYQSMYEPCLMGCKGKSIKKWHGGRKQRSVIETIDFMTEDELRETIKTLLADEEPDIIRERKQVVNDLHPTMKPIRLLAKFVTNSSDENDIVMDLFGGSGSTLMACEQLGRRCYMSELDPHYCDVIIQRWENFTGRKAEKVNV